LKVFPSKLNRVHETEWQYTEVIPFFAVVRAPLFTLTLYSHIFKKQGEEPSEDMLLELKPQVKVCVDPPFINPSSLHTEFGEVLCAYVSTRAANFPVQQIKLDSPLSLVSVLEQALSNFFKPYVQIAKEVSKDLDASTPKARVMRVYVLFYAFMGVVNILLKHAGFDFTVEIELPALHSFQQPNEGFTFNVAGVQSFRFKYTKKPNNETKKFVLREEIDIGVDEFKWYCHKPLEVKFWLEDSAPSDVVKISFSADETKDITDSLYENLEKVKSKMLDFARQVQEYLRKVSD